MSASTQSERIADGKELIERYQQVQLHITMARLIALQKRIQPYVGRREGRGRLWLRWAEEYNRGLVRGIFRDYYRTALLTLTIAGTVRDLLQPGIRCGHTRVYDGERTV